MLALVVVAAAAGGAGLWMLMVALAPPKLTLAQQLAQVDAATRKAAPAEGDSLAGRLGSRSAGVLARLGLPSERTRSELVLLERAVEALLAQKTMTALVGLLLPMGSFAALTIAGLAVPLAVPGVAGICLAAVLFFVPDLALHSEAEEYRASARIAVRLFLDQSAITLAGGAGIEQALIAAAGGHGPTFRRIRQALQDAQVRREPAWSHLDALGRELGLRELSELAAACALAGSEGAKVRSSISARARAMREREFASSIEAAESATERLTVPGGLLGMSFVCFLVYAALAAAARQM